MRYDLEGLRSYFNTPTLSEGLQSNGVKRVLEVGVRNDFDAIRQILFLKHDQTKLFSVKDDLWVVDPQIDDDSELQYMLVRDIFGQFSVARERIEDFKNRIGHNLAPFDLVFCKGTTHGESDKGVILKDMATCLNPQNPKALLMIAGIDKFRYLPYTVEDLESYGLDLVYSQQSLSQGTKYPNSLIICKKK